MKHILHERLKAFSLDDSPMSSWIELTSRTDRTKVWVNMEAATSVAKDASGARISLQGRERDLFVAETPETIMARREGQRSRD